MKKDLKAILDGIMDRNGMSRSQLAQYLGIPRVTLEKWLSGERYPGSATLRLIEVLGMIENMNQDIHEILKE